VKDLVWDNTLSVQVTEIDEDHRRLIDLFNLLKHSVVEGDSETYIDAVMEELITCTVWHFRHEERLMLKHDYKGFEEHKKEHQELIESAIDLQQKIQKNGTKISNEDIKYLEHWLTGHILSTDMDLGSYLGELI
jgi:hemerythrin-like metal-binding protein